MRVGQIKKILIDLRNIVILSFTFCFIMLTSRTNVKDNDRNNVLLKTKYSALIVDESKKTIEDVEKKLKPFKILKGGKFKPYSSQNKNKLAFIIPYRDRYKHLINWLNHVHPLLVKQKIEYQVFIVEQNDNFPFNRGALLNVGFHAIQHKIINSNSAANFTCFIFHDVDMVPETEFPLYKCPTKKKEANHLAVSVSRWNYRLTYPNYVGGIVAMQPDTFINIGGFSNSFWGWGGEDDNFHCRLKRNNVSVIRFAGSQARFRMLKHDPVPVNPDIFELSEKSKVHELTDGVENVKYEVEKVSEEPLYTLIKIRLTDPPKKKEKGILDSISETIQDKQTQFFNKVAEELNKFNEEVMKDKEEFKPKVKIYY